MTDSEFPEWLVDPNADKRQRREQLEAHASGDGVGDVEAAYAHHVIREDFNLDRSVSQVKSIIATDDDTQDLLGTFELTRDIELDKDQYRRFVDQLRPLLADNDIHLNDGEMQAVAGTVYDHLLGIEVIGGPWRDDAVTEIMVNGHDTIYVERNGTIQRRPDLAYRSLHHAQETLRNLARNAANRSLSVANPVVDAQLADGGGRMLLMMDPVVPSGISLTLRKRGELITMDTLVNQYQSLTPQMREFLADCTAGRAAMLIAGGTGTGKTTIINAVSESIPDTERIITIEDTLELQLRHPHVVRMLEKQQATSDDDVEVPIAQLIRAALRARPDRILVGEMRDHHAANVMISAAESGHDGTMSTLHANNASDAVNQRLSGMLAEARPGAPLHVVKQMILNAFEVVVHVERRGSKRYLAEICAVGKELDDDGDIPLTTIFAGQYDGQGTVTFEQTSALPVGSRLYDRLVQEGVDPHRWTA